MDEATKKAVYVHVVGASALAAQAGAGALIARALNRPALLGATLALGAVLAVESMPRAEPDGIDLTPTAKVLVAPALLAEKLADGAIRPVLGWTKP